MRYLRLNKKHRLVRFYTFFFGEIRSESKGFGGKALLLIGLGIFISSCAPTAYKNLKPIIGDVHCVTNFKPFITRALYQTQVDVTGNHLSGILIIKQMPDSSTRLVFSNEAGFKFFDFEFSKDGTFKVYSIIKKMDKEAVKTTLKKDFELVLMNALRYNNGRVLTKGGERFNVFSYGEDHFYYITDKDCLQLLRMERGNAKKKIVEAQISDLKNGVPDSIAIHHLNFNFDIKLNRIYDNAE